MMRSRRGVVLFSIILFLAVNILPSYTVSAGIISRDKNIDVSRTLKVGYYDLEGFQYINESDAAIGYNAEYLNMIALFTGWDIEFVNVGNFSQGQEMLFNKQIDIIAPCIKTSAGEEKYDFSRYSFGTDYTVLVTDAANQDYYYEDYKYFGEMTVAVVKEYYQTEAFIRYMEENSFSAKLLYYDTEEQAQEAFENGQAQAMIMSIMRASNNYKILARFNPTPFYYMTWKGNDELLDQLDKIMQNLQNTYPSLLDELLARYFPVYSEQYFTRAETEYIASLDSLKVGYVGDYSPLSFTGDNGEFVGITRDILDKIQAVSGLNFEYVELPDGAVTYDYLSTNGFDLVSGVVYNSTNLNSTGIMLSSPYISGKKVIVSRKDFVFDESKNSKIAVSTGSMTLKKVLAKSYPKFEIVDYDDIDDCFKAVNEGKVDLLIQNQYVTDYYLAKPIYENLNIIPIEGLNDDLCMSTVISLRGMHGMDDEESFNLITIINKALSKITDDEIDTIIAKGTAEYHYKYTIVDMLYLYRLPIIFLTVSLITFILIITYIIIYKEKNSNILREEERNLRLQQKRYEMLLENSEEMIYELSMLGKACISTDRIKQKFGWEIPSSVENITYERFISILHIYPQDRDKFVTAAKEIIEENKAKEVLVRLLDITGKHIWCRITCLPLLDDDNVIASIVGKIKDVNDEIKDLEKLQLQSNTDALTGLLNKRAFREKVEECLESITAERSAMVFVDLDNFKSVNDTFGHSTGDIAIQEAANRLREYFSSGELVSRFGGDEFCIFIKSISEQLLESRLIELMYILKDKYNNDTAVVDITASIGAAYLGEENAAYEKMLDTADAALYEVKQNGRNGYRIKKY